ncbi:MAG: hypothetical protein ACP5U1_15120 [Desulfomonilaceae bacterium]
MKYLSTFLTIILLWLAADEFILKKNEAGRKYSIVDRWKELGKRIHYVIGTIATAILIVYAFRLIVHFFL